jgi:hypothetical protein
MSHVSIEQSLPGDYIIQPMQDSRILLGCNVLGKGKRIFMQLINESNKCIKLPGGKRVGFAQIMDNG